MTGEVIKTAPAYTFHLNNPIEPGLVCIGKYDGKRPSLTCATSAGKILIHSPHERSYIDRSGQSSEKVPVDSLQDTRFLNINKKITALAAGALDQNAEHDTLLIGTETNLLAYDVEKNSDIFYKDLTDGVGALAMGCLPSSQEPLVVVGGNCSIQGFNADGIERY
ncbi:unnamed protein product, partial [Choristocarpus tenellus]